MKKILLLIALSCVSIKGFSLNQKYTYVSGLFTTPGNWVGTSGPASAFTDATDTFVTTTALNINAAWNVAGVFIVGDGATTVTVTNAIGAVYGSVIVTNNATLTITTNPTGGAITVNNGGSLNQNVLSTAVSPNMAAIQGATSNITYGAGASHVLPAITFGNLTLNDAIAFTMGGNITVAGTLNFTSGTLTLLAANSLTLNGTVTGMSAARFFTGSATSTLSLGASGIIGTLFFAAGTTVPNFNMTGGGVAAFGNSVTIGTNLNLTGGSGGILGLSAGTLLTLGGTFSTNSTDYISPDPASSITVSSVNPAAGTLTFDPGATTFTTLTCSGAAGVTTLGSNITVTTLALSNATATLADNGFTVTVTGNFTGTGKHTGTGLVYMNGSGASIGNLALTGNLTLDNAGGFSLTGGATTTVSGVLTFNNGKLVIGTNTLAFATGGSVAGMTSTNCLTGSGTSNLTVTSNTSIGTLLFDGTTPGTTDKIATFLMSTAGGQVTMGSNMSILTSLNLSIAGAIFNDGGFIVSLAGSIAGPGTHTSTGSGKITMTATGKNIGAEILGNIELNTGGNTTLNGAATIKGSLTFTSGKLSLAGFVLTFGPGGSVMNMDPTHCFVGSATSGISITNTGSIGTIFFDTTTLGTSNKLASLVMNAAGATATLGNSLNVTALTLTNGILATGPNNLTITGAFTGTALHYITGDPGANLTVGTASTYYFDQSVPGTTNAFSSFTLTGAVVTTLGASNPITVGTLNLGTGTLADGGNTVTVTSSLTGTGSHTGAGKLSLTGSSMTIPAMTATGNVQLNNAAGFALAGNPIVTGALTFTAGNLSIGNNTLTMGVGSTVASMSATNCFTCNGSSNFTVTATATLNGTIFFDQTNIAGGSNSIATFLMSGAGGIATLAASNPITVGTLTLTNGTLADGGNIITVTGNVNGAGSHSGAGRILMNGGSVPTLSGLAATGNVEFNNAAGFALSGNPTVSGLLTFTNGNLTIGAHTLTIGLGGSVTGMSSANCFTGNGSSSNLTVSATASAGTMFFDQTTPGTTDNIATFIVSAAGGSVTLGSNVSVLTALTLTAATSTLNDNGFVITNAGNITGVGIHSGTGKISMTGSGKTITALAGLGNLEVNPGAGNSIGLAAASALITNGNIIFTAGKFTIGANTLTLGPGTSITGLTATNCFVGGATSNLTITKTSSVGTLIFDHLTTPGTTDNIATLNISSAGGAMTLGSDISISTALTLGTATSTFNDGGDTVFCAGSLTGSGIFTSTGAGEIRMTATGKNIGGVTLGNIELNTGGTTTLNGNATLKGTMVFTSGSLTLAASTFTIGTGGSVSGMNGTTNFFSCNGGVSSALTITATSNVGTLYFDPSGTNNELNIFTINGVGALATLGNAMQVNTTLALSAGTLADGGNVITLVSANITGTGTHTSSSGGKINVTVAAGCAISAVTLGNVDLNNAAVTTCTGTTITGALNFVLAGSSLAIGGSSVLTLSGTVSGMDNVNRWITGSANSDMTISSTGALGSLFFNPSPVANQTIRNFKITGGGSATLGNSMTCSTLLDLTTVSGGSLAVASGATLTLAGTFNTASAKYLSMDPASLINVTSVNPSAGTLYFDPSAHSFNTLTITGLLGVTTLGTDITVGTLALTGSTGTIADGGHTITVTGNVTGTGKHTGAGKITMTGAGGAITGVVTTIGNLEINCGAGNTTNMNAALTTNAGLIFTSGSLSIGSNTLTLGAGTAVTNNATGNNIKGSATSVLAVTATGNIGTLYFDQTTPGTSNEVSTLTISGANGSMAVGNNMAVLTSVTLTNATDTIRDGGDTITCAGNILGAGVHVSTGSGEILLNGGSAQQLSNITTGNLELNNAAGLSLSANPIVNGLFTFTNGKLTIGAHTLTFATGGSVSNMAAARSLVCNGATSLITVTSSGNIGTLFFDQSALPASENVTTFLMNGGGSATMGSNLKVGALTLTSGHLAVGADSLIITGAFSGSAGVGYLTGGPSSILNSGTTATYYFDQSAPGTSNNFSVFTLLTGNTVTLGNAVSVGNLNFGVAGILADGGNVVTCSGNITGTGTHSGTGKITKTGNGTTISSITPGNLEIKPGAGNSVAMAGALTTNSGLIFSSGTFSIGSNTLTIGPGTAVTNNVTGNNIKGSATSALAVTATTNIGTLYFDQTTPGTSNEVSTLTISGANGSMAVGNNMAVLTSMTLTNATDTIRDGGDTITCAGNILGAGVHVSTGSGEILLNGGSAQQLSNITTGNLELNNAAGLSLSANPIVNGLFTFTNGKLTIGAHTLTFATGGSVSNMAAARSLVCNGATSLITVTSNGNIGTLFFDQSALPASENVTTFLMNGGGSATMGSNLKVGALTLTSGHLAVGADSLIITGAFSGSAGVGYLSGGPSSILNTGTTATYYFDQSAPGTSNNFSVLTLLTGNTVTLGNAVSVGNLNFGLAGILADGGTTVNCSGNITGTGTHSGSGRITMTRNGTTISSITPGNLEINPGAGNSVAMSGALTTNNGLIFTSGSFSIGGNTLTIGPGTVVTNNVTGNNLRGSATSALAVTATTNVGTLYFDQTTPGTSNEVSTLTISGANGSMSLGNNMAVLTSMTLTNATDTIRDGGDTISCAGSVAGLGAHISTGSGEIKMTATGKTIACGAIGNLELSTGGITTLGSNMNLSGKMTFTSGNLVLSTFTLNMLPGSSVSGMSTSRYFTCNNGASSAINITATGNVGTLFFDPTTPLNTNSLKTFTINGAGALATLGNAMEAKTTLALTNGTLADNGQVITVAGNITGTGTHTSLTGGKISMITTASTISGATFGNLELSLGAAGVFTLTGNPTVNGALTFTGGVGTIGLVIASDTLTLNGTVSGMSATHYFTGNTTVTNSNIKVTSTGILGTMFFNPATPGTTNNFASFTMNGAGGTATIGNALSIGTGLALTAGTLAAGTNPIALTTNASITGTGTHTSSGAGIITMGASGGATLSGATLGNLTITTSANVSLTGDPVINGNLVLSSGKFDVGTHNLTFGPSGAFSGVPSVSNMLYSSAVTPGQVRKQFSGTGSFTYPVGDATPLYTPITLNFTGGTFTGNPYAGVFVKNTVDPHNGNTASYINRYWGVTTTVASPAYNVTNATYVLGDVVPTESNMVFGVYPGSLPWIKETGSSTNTTTHVISETGSITSAYAEITGINSANPSVHISSPDASTICSGGSVSLNANAVGDTPFHYFWAPSSGLSATTGQHVIASPTSDIIYTLSAVDANGDTATVKDTLYVTPAVIASATNDGPICSGGTVNLNANPSGAAATFAWAGPSLSSSGVYNPSATPAATVDYTVTVTDGTTNNGCVLTLTTTVSVNPTPVAAPSSSGPLCFGNTESLFANPAGGASLFTWSGPNLSSGAAQNPTATPTVTSTYSLTVSSGAASGCSPATVYTISVTVNSLPAITAVGNNAPLCEGLTLNLTSSESGGSGPGTYNYSWTGPNLFTASVQNPAIPSVTAAASGTYTLVVTDANGCSATGANTTSATVYPDPVISAIGNNSPLCSITTTLNLTSAASGGTGTLVYAWSGPASFSSSLQNPSIPAVTTAASGTYTLTVTDANSCSGTGANTTTVTINPTPDAGTISGATGECLTSSTSLGETVGGGTWSLPGVIATIDGTGSVTGVTIGADIVTYSVATAFCSNRTTYNFNVEGTSGDIYTIAGTGVQGYTGDGAAAVNAKINGPRDMVTDTFGNLYFCDVTANVIRKVSANGIITTVVGNGSVGNGGDGGQATNASLSQPNGIYVDNGGNIYFSNTNSHTIRKVTAKTGIITTIAGTAGSYGYSGDGGSALSATFNAPLGITKDATGNIYIADQLNYVVRRIDASSGIITTVAGTNSNAYSGDGGQGTAARLSTPRGLAIDNANNLYIADGGNSVVRMLSLTTGIITTVAGNGTLGYSGDGGAATAAALKTPGRLVYDGGSMLYESDLVNNRVRQINLSTGIINTVAGTGVGGYNGDGGSALTATINQPYGVAIDKYGNLFIGDAVNRRIRAIPAPVSLSITLAGPTSVVAGTSITFTAFTSMENNVTYQWQNNGSNISGATNVNYTDNAPVNGNIYRCIVAVSPECGAAYNDTSNAITITVTAPPPAYPSGVPVTPLSPGLAVYPNPVSGILNVNGTHYADGTAQITVYDQLTRVVISKSCRVINGVIDEKLDVHELANGLYILSVSDNDQKIGLTKFVKN